MGTTPAIRQHIEEGLAKLAKWQTKLINPYIILSKQSQGIAADTTLNTLNGQLVARDPLGHVSGDKQATGKT